MSSFSSVIRKPGQKIAPKVAPKRVARRNVVEQPAQIESTLPSAEINLPPVEPERLQADTDTASIAEVSTRSTRSQEPVINGTADTFPANGEAIEVAQQNPEQANSELAATPVSGTAEVATASPVSSTQQRQSQQLRKSTPQAGATSTSRPSKSVTPVRAPSEASRASSVQTDIESATQRLSSISDIARQIDPTIAADERRLGYRLSQTRSQNTDTDANDLNARPKKRRRKNPPPEKTVEQQAAEVVANATGQTDLIPRRRKGTPEDAAEHEIQEEGTLMGELCKDRKWGRKSAIEQQMQANWPEILRRRREDRDRAMRDLETRRAKRAGAAAATQPSAEDLARREGQAIAQIQDVPEQIIVNGQIVIAQESREIDRSAQLEQVLEDPANQVHEDADIYKRVNQATVGMKNAIPPGERWDEHSTELFYQGLRMFGTDFMMISKMIPGKSRRQVKLKYNIEERLNLGRVNRNVVEKQQVDLDQYGQMANLQFKNADDVYKQIEEDERRLRAEDERRRQEEGIIPQRSETQQDGDPDLIMPSIEHDGTDLANTDDLAQGTEPRDRTTSRVASTATTTQPAPTKKKLPRKTNPSAKSRRNKYDSSGATFQGVEERIGDADKITVNM